MDDIWWDVLKETLSYFSQETIQQEILPLAIKFSNQ